MYDLIRRLLIDQNYVANFQKFLKLPQLLQLGLEEANKMTETKCELNFGTHPVRPFYSWSKSLILEVEIEKVSPVQQFFSSLIL